MGRIVDQKYFLELYSTIPFRWQTAIPRRHFIPAEAPTRPPPGTSLELPPRPARPSGQRGWVSGIDGVARAAAGASVGQHLPPLWPAADGIAGSAVLPEIYHDRSRSMQAATGCRQGVEAGVQAHGRGLSWTGWAAALGRRAFCSGRVWRRGLSAAAARPRPRGARQSGAGGLV